MSVQMIELEEVATVEVSDDAFESLAKVAQGGVYTKLVNTANVC